MKVEEKKICDYGCGRQAHYQMKNGKWCCQSSYNRCPQIKRKNSEGLKKRHKIKPCWVSDAIKVNYHSWNKGQTKATNKKIAETSLRLKQRYANGELKNWCDGKNLSEETKKKISNSMKKAHAEGRAHNIGQCRWNNKPSYPEQFFMEVIKNEFQDKDYQKEYPFFKYSIDFAWVNKKLAIEIDGQQHQRDEKQKTRDLQKDKLLKENGWKLLRIKWKDMYNDSKFWINKSKLFIDG